jgi:hypothetical protein
MKSISRLDRPEERLVGWNVRVTYKYRRYCRFFPDAKYGGKKKALAEAIHWRDDIEVKIGKPRSERLVQPHRNGIRIVSKDCFPKVMVYWNSEPGKTVRRFFSITKYGRRKAMELAKETLTKNHYLGASK